jgi:hypothetical protein
MSSTLTPEEKRILDEINIVDAYLDIESKLGHERCKRLRDDLLSGDPERKQRAVKDWGLQGLNRR